MASSPSRSPCWCSGSASRPAARRIGRRYLIGPAGYVVAALVGLVVPWLALLLYAMLNAFFLWPGGIDEVALARQSEGPVTQRRRYDAGYREQGRRHHRSK